MKKVFHKIYCNLANLTGDAAGETYAFVYAKPPYLVMKCYALFSKRQSWFWLLFKPLIFVKAKMNENKKMKQNAYYHKINILTEKKHNW